jgi:hypothetical protein
MGFSAFQVEIPEAEKSAAARNCGGFFGGQVRRRVQYQPP